MAKRLNPKRRRELWERRMTTLLRPSELTTEGHMRSVYDSKTWKRPKGSSDGLARGLLYDESGAVTYAKHKRRKAVKPALHVNPKDAGKIPTPEKVKDRLDAQWPLPRKTAKKLWSNS